MRILAVMRRKPGALVPLEQDICAAAWLLRSRGIEEFHGYELAKQLADQEGRRLLTGYGTLYRALARLEEMGLLRSRREAPEIAARENRPGRRFYSLTPEGAIATKATSSVPSATLRRKRAGEAPA